MLKTRIIPTLLYKDFGLVKGERFDSLRAVGSALQAVKVYSLRGVDELAFLDVTATLQGREPDYALIDELADDCFMPLTVGGGVRTLDDVRKLLDCGADKISVNSTAVSNPQFVKDASTKCGSQCIVVAIDARKKSDGSGWEVFTHGGRKETGLDTVEWAKRMEEYGAGEILLTSMDKDGQKTGFDLELTRSVADALSIPVIASGGVGNLQHLVDGVKQGHASAVLAASIFHFGTHTIAEAKDYFTRSGIPVRERYV